MKSRIRAFLAESLLSADIFPYRDDESLFETGVVDSMGILELVLFVEETFGIEVPEDDVIPDHFDSIDKLAAYIESRQAGHAIDRERERGR